MMRRIWWVLAVVVIGGAGVGLGSGLSQISSTSADVNRAWDEIYALRDTVNQANKDRAAQGLAPVDMPAPTTEAPAGWLQGNRGEKGAPGIDAPAPTSAQMFTAVSAFCSMRAECAGPVGPVSITPGPAGIDGVSITGETGAAGSTGAMGDRGEKGDPGSPGIDAAPAVNLASVVCSDVGDWVITFTDGTTSVTPGPCRIVPTTPAEVAP